MAVVDRELMLALPLIEQAAIVVRLGVVGLERDRLVEVVERLRAVPLLAVHDAAAEIGRRVGAIERERPVIVGEREIEPARVPNYGQEYFLRHLFGHAGTSAHLQREPIDTRLASAVERCK